MSRLDPSERKALKQFTQGPKLAQSGTPQVSMQVYLQQLAQLPESLRPKKPARFQGKHWKL